LENEMLKKNLKDLMDTRSNATDSEAANVGVLQINCSAPARKVN